MFATVTLRTRAGEDVGTVEVPDFKPPAEVLVWGQRFFTLASLGADGALVYVEAMAFFIVEPVTMPDGTVLPLGRGDA